MQRLFIMDEKTAIKIIELSYLVSFGREIREDELKQFLNDAKELEIVSREILSIKK